MFSVNRLLSSFIIVRFAMWTFPLLMPMNEFVNFALFCPIILMSLLSISISNSSNDSFIIIVVLLG